MCTNHLFEQYFFWVQLTAFVDFSDLRKRFQWVELLNSFEDT